MGGGYLCTLVEERIIKRRDKRAMHTCELLDFIILVCEIASIAYFFANSLDFCYILAISKIYCYKPILSIIAIAMHSS